MLIFEQSRDGRTNPGQAPATEADVSDIPEQFLRKEKPLLPEVSEMQAVRHYTRLSQQNFSIDTHFYPLGSCTMKYNPRACNTLAMLPGFLGRHPHAPAVADATNDGAADSIITFTTCGVMTPNAVMTMTPLSQPLST